MRAARPLFFALLPLLASCQLFDTRGDSNAGQVRLQGELSVSAGRLTLRPCGDERQLVLGDNGPTSLSRDAAALFSDGSGPLFVDVLGIPSDGHLKVTQLYRLQQQGHGCDDPEFKRLLLRASGNEPGWSVEIGRRGMIEKVAAGVREAMKRAGIDDPADVHYVQTKTPLLTIHTIRDAKSRGKTVWTENTHESMDLSNGTTALGIAVALGEIEMPDDADVMHRRDLYSSVASCSSGVELDRAQIVVVGNTRGIGGRYRIGHSVMRDALDTDGIWAAIRDAGLELPERPHPSDLKGRLVNVFLKCEASSDGQVRGRRNAMLDDSDVHWHRQIKACVGGVTASVTGDPAVFVSVSATHQGPDGGGPVAAIVDLGPEPVTGYTPASI